MEDFASNPIVEKIDWTPLSITHIEYPKGDVFGKCLAMISMLPLAIVVAFITLILFRRDLHTITYFVGICISEGLNMILKIIIRDARPCKGRQTVYMEFGMPSSHAQLMWFFSSYLALFVLIRLHHTNSTSVLENCWKYVVVLVAFGGALVVSYSRIYLEYHTWQQVFCGALVGTALACVWFAIMQLVLTPLFPAIASWPISEFLMLRDTTLIPNIMWFEYTSHRSEARQDLLPYSMGSPIVTKATQATLGLQTFNL